MDAVPIVPAYTTAGDDGTVTSARTSAPTIPLPRRVHVAPRSTLRKTPLYVVPAYTTPPAADARCSTAPLAVATRYRCHVAPASTDQ